MSKDGPQPAKTDIGFALTLVTILLFLLALVLAGVVVGLALAWLVV